MSLPNDLQHVNAANRNQSTLHVVGAISPRIRHQNTINRGLRDAVHREGLEFVHSHQQIAHSQSLDAHIHFDVLILRKITLHERRLQGFQVGAQTLDADFNRMLEEDKLDLNGLGVDLLWDLKGCGVLAIAQKD